MAAAAATGLLTAGAAAASTAPDAAPLPHVESALFIPRGTFYRPVRQWTFRVVEPRFSAIAPTPSASLRLPLDFAPPRATIPGLEGFDAGPTKLKRFAAGLGKRLMKRLREAIEAAGDANDPSGGLDLEDPAQDVMVETCGLAASWGTDALADGIIDRADLATLVSSAERVGWTHALRRPGRESFAEAAHLTVTVADYAERLRAVANRPEDYVSNAGTWLAAQPMRDALIGRACGRALRDAGLTGVRVRSTGWDSSMRFTVPAFGVLDANRAAADGLRCRAERASMWEVSFERCSWDSPFAS